MCVSRRAPLLLHYSLATLLPVATIATLWLYGSTCAVQYSMLTLTAGMLCLLRETLSLGHEDTEPEPEPEPEPSLSR